MTDSLLLAVVAASAAALAVPVAALVALVAEAVVVVAVVAVLAALLVLLLRAPDLACRFLLKFNHSAGVPLGLRRFFCPKGDRRGGGRSLRSVTATPPYISPGAPT